MPKKKLGKHLQFYMDCVKNTLLPYDYDGLCSCADNGLISAEILVKYFEPSESELDTLRDENHSRLYYGSGLPGCDFGEGIFTPLRQTIVLFMAAIAGEL